MTTGTLTFSHNGPSAPGSPREIELHLQMPAMRGRATQDRQRVVEADHRRVDEVQAHPAHAETVHFGEFVVGDAGAQYRDRAEGRATRAQPIERRAVVGAVHARLHDHPARDSGGAHHVAVSVDAAFMRRVVSPWIHRVAVLRAEHVEVRVAGPGGQGMDRRQRIPRRRIAVRRGRFSVRHAARPGTRKSKSQPSSACSTVRWNSAA